MKLIKNYEHKDMHTCRIIIMNLIAMFNNKIFFFVRPKAQIKLGISFNNTI